jgi:diguanylate cyclase (GGDEF)-like protein
MTTAKPIRTLLVEDSDLDAAFIQLTLKRGNINADIHRVETRENFVEALTSERWDVILSDYHLPRFTAADALSIVTSFAIDTPFIVVSGAIGEDTAVDLMRQGAHDYVLKDRLARLPAAIEREIEQANQRRLRRRTDTLFRAVLRGSPFPSAILEPHTGKIVDCTDAFARSFYTATEPPHGGTFFDIVRFSHPERIHQLLRRGSGTAWYAVYYNDEVGRMANVSCYSIDHEGAAYTYVVLEDVTEQHYLKAAFDAVSDAVLIIGSDNRLLYANHAAEQLFDSLYFQMDIAPVLVFDGYSDGWWKEGGQYEQKITLESGQKLAASSVIFRFAGESNASAIVTLRNVAEEQHLLELATHDPLTGAYNVRFFEGALLDSVTAAAAEGIKGSLALLDLDYFKPINDEFGHAAGDHALKTFVAIARTALDPTDVFARIGGDEFAIIFCGRDARDSSEIVKLILDRLAASPLTFDQQTRALSASAGIAPIRTLDSAAAVKARADRALYSVKRTGRGRISVAFDTSDGTAKSGAERQFGLR